MFFELPVEQQQILFDFIQNHVTSGAQDHVTQKELEIRFGKFIWSKGANGNSTNFKSGVDRMFFYNVKKTFSSKPSSTINTTEEIYKSNEQNYKNNKNYRNFKKIISEDGVITNIQKETIKKYNVFDYDFRISYSNEKQINEEFNTNNMELTIVRNKNRQRFDLEFAYLDLTHVNSDSEETFEIEIEIKNNPENDVTTVYNTVINLICVLLQIRCDNFYVISNREQNDIIKEYKNMVNCNYFVGAQPETLHKEQISNLYKERYSVTDKADGDRCFILIDQNGYLYCLDNNIQNVIRTDLFSHNFKKCLLDAEIIRTNQKIYIYIFDILISNNIDIRENRNFLLCKRIDIIKDIVANITSYSNFSQYEICCKTFIYKNVFLGGELLLNEERVYKNDGLIFTPMDEPYPKTKKWSKLLKWKPAHLNTIDFYAVRIGNSENWELYVQEFSKKPNEVGKIDGNIVLFDISKFDEKIENNNICTYMTTFSDEMIDKTTGEPFKTNTVIEFYWDNDYKKFVPLRTRWDKTNNPKKHGNFISVAKDIWKSINNPITKDFLTKFTVPCNKDIYFERMRRFHNKVKEYLYNTYCNNTNKLLELCSGRGGDLNKWKYNNINIVHGYDISQKNIEECERRVEMAKYSDKYKFYNLDLSTSNAINIVSKNMNTQKYDNICCNFGIHYFFKNKDSFDNIKDILKSTIKKEGYFIVTFMDNKKIEEILGDKKIVYNQINGDIIYYLEKKHDTNTEFDNKLRIVLNGNNILGEGSDEYIINLDNFIKNMKEIGFNVIENKLFSNIYDKFMTNPYNLEQLSDVEKDISFLNRYMVFQFTEKDDNNTLDLNLYNQKNKKIDSDNIFNKKIDLHMNNLSVHKIVDTYDIIDIINCIEYKYYKNKHDNNQIETFDTILDTFSKYNIKNTPIYIDNIYESNIQDSFQMNGIYFTYYKHIIEKGEELLEYDNWYVILHNDMVIWHIPIIEKSQDYTNNQLDEKDVVNKKDDNLDKIVDKNTANKKDDNSNKIDKELIKSIVTNPKVTLKQLKDVLREYNLKISGNKSELIARLGTLL